MLVLSRKLKQEILIGENIKITVLKVKGNTVRLGIEAPRDIHVVRGELPQDKKPAAVPVTNEDGDTAEFTIVFSNNSELETEQTEASNVIPFENASKSAPKSSRNIAAPNAKRSTQAPDSIKFSGRLPTSLHNNRLKEIVSQLTTKSRNQ